MNDVKLKLDWCSHKAAKYAVEHWHYSKRMPKSKIAKIGVWEDDVFIGVVLFGVGATKDIVSPYGLQSTQGCELVRVALKEHKTSVTKIISISIKLLKKTFPKLRLIVSYADPFVGHLGGIYQGGNWIYNGRTPDAKFPILDGRVAHNRTLSLRIKAGKIKRNDVEFVKRPGKHRYLYPLSKSIKSQIEKLRVPYPKEIIADKALK